LHDEVEIFNFATVRAIRTDIFERMPEAVNRISCNRSGLTEVGLQPGTGEQSAALSRQSLHTPPPATAVEQAPVQDEASREREELRMLAVGFGTGILIAFLFLIYIVLSFSGVMP
jgi:hypothetical protein